MRTGIVGLPKREIGQKQGQPKIDKNLVTQKLQLGQHPAPRASREYGMRHLIAYLELEENASRAH